MTTVHNLGFPRIGAQRELKFALESYWKGESSRDALKSLGAELRQRHWDKQAGLDLVPVGDFAFYDQVLDMSFTLGNLPERVSGFHGDQLDNYFRVARGRSAESAEQHHACCGGVAAGEMTKWFDTNYHYIVPEFTAATEFKLDASRLLVQLAEAKQQGVKAKPVIVGPVTYLALGKAKDGTDKLALLPALLAVYSQLLDTLAAQGVEWVQIDEPILVTELDADWQHAFNLAYHQLKACRVKLLVASYFGQLQENLYLAANLPVAGLHIDAVNGHDDIRPLLNLLPSHKVLSLGVINGRNIWKTDLNAVLDWLEPLAERLGERLWIAPSCSLLHVPVDLDSEQKLDAEIKSWLSFALQKLEELQVLAQALRCAARPQPGRATGHRRHRSRPGRPQEWLHPARRRSSRAAEAAGLSDDDHRLLPADGGNPPCPQRVQGRQARRRKLQGRHAGGNRPQRARAGSAGPGRVGARRGRA